MVWASTPLPILPNRTLAFPVGASKSTPSFFICEQERNVSTTVVLPVPAPPVKTESFLSVIISNASICCLVASRLFSLFLS